MFTVAHLPRQFHHCYAWRVEGRLASMHGRVRVTSTGGDATGGNDDGGVHGLFLLMGIAIMECYANIQGSCLY